MDEERIRRRAYELWEQDGRPEGRHDEHWVRAHQDVAGGADTSGGAADAGPMDVTDTAAGSPGTSTAPSAGGYQVGAPDSGDGRYDAPGGGKAGEDTGHVDLADPLGRPRGERVHGLDDGREPDSLDAGQDGGQGGGENLGRAADSFRAVDAGLPKDARPGHTGKAGQQPGTVVEGGGAAEEDETTLGGAGTGGDLTTKRP